MSLSVLSSELHISFTLLPLVDRKEISRKVGHLHISERMCSQRMKDTDGGRIIPSNQEARAFTESLFV